MSEQQERIENGESAGAGRGRPGEEEVVPVVREEVEVGRRQRETGRVVVHIVPTVRNEVVEVALAEEHVEVERVPINRVVEVPPGVREEGEVLVVPVFEEVLVVEKKLMLKEEVRIRRRRTVRQERQEVALRGEEVQIRREEIRGP